MIGGSTTADQSFRGNLEYQVRAGGDEAERRWVHEAPRSDFYRPIRFAGGARLSLGERADGGEFGRSEGMLTEITRCAKIACPA